MSITDEQREKVRDWMFLKQINPKCESCSHSNWEQADIITAPDYSLERPGSQILQVFCDNCGFIRQYSGVIIGLTP